MRQPGDQPLGSDIGVPGNARDALSMGGDPFIGQPPRHCIAIVRARGADMPQPGKAMQPGREFPRRQLDGEGRIALGLQEPPGQWKPALGNLVGDEGVCGMQVGRRNHQPARAGSETRK